MVPVPCASTYCTSAAATDARAQASASTARCALGLGAVSPFENPSLFTAVARTRQ
jgi:hypothetical protein